MLGRLQSVPVITDSHIAPPTLGIRITRLRGQQKTFPCKGLRHAKNVPAFDLLRFLCGLKVLPGRSRGNGKGLAKQSEVLVRFGLEVDLGSVQLFPISQEKIAAGF